ncbi:MAG: hypothetical protein QUS12_11185 [Methanosarcina sp.]|nr:hypothetical protein [Methanosarcina sp.]
MAKGRGKDYFCSVVTEKVEITLKNKPSLVYNAPKEFFVQCNQSDCQYVDTNELPCPLKLDLFTLEMETLEERRRERANN